MKLPLHLSSGAIAYNLIVENELNTSKHPLYKERIMTVRYSIIDPLLNDLWVLEAASDVDSNFRGDELWEHLGAEYHTLRPFLEKY